MLKAMKTTPFDRSPFLEFLLHLLVPVVAWLLLCWAITGLLYPRFWLAKPRQLSAVYFDPDGWIRLYEDISANLTQPPGVCISKKDLKDVEADLCRDFASLLRQREMIAFFPWAVLSVYLYLSILVFKRFYRRVAAHIRQSRPEFVGKVLPHSFNATPPRVQGPGVKSGSTVQKPRFNFFKRFYLLRSIQVELPDKSIVTAYLGTELQKPKKGQSVLIYEVSSLLSGKCYIAVLDYPHLAIVRGL